MIRYAIFFLALLIGGWMTFDGARAIISGSYTTPSSGPYAGQLGPWSKVVSRIGLDPASVILKSAHVVFGVSWLVFGLLLFLGTSLVWWPLMLTALFSLWYLPFGTIIGFVVAGLLLLPSV